MVTKRILKQTATFAKSLDPVTEPSFAAFARSTSGQPRTVLLTGPISQTSEAASTLAREIGVEVLRVDLSQIVSKFIGETEKNLDRVFREAETQGALLFFDEADALFGKRTGVRDSHDRFANAAAAKALVQRMEKFPGIAVLATGRSNLDPPFTRRFGFRMDVAARREGKRGA